MERVQRRGEQAPLGPPYVVVLAALLDARVAAAAQDVNQLLVHVLAGIERLAGRDLHDDGVHVDVAREVAIKTATADLGPRLQFLGRGVGDGIAFDPRHARALQPFAVEIALDATAATDIRGADLWLSRRGLAGRPTARRTQKRTTPQATDLLHSEGTGGVTRSDSHRSPSWPSSRIRPIN